MNLPKYLSLAPALSLEGFPFIPFATSLALAYLLSTALCSSISGPITSEPDRPKLEAGQENSPGCLARLSRGKEITLDGTGGWLLLAAAAWTVAVLEC